MANAQGRHASLTQTFEERASLPRTAPLAAYLLQLAAIKRSNLCVSADVTTTRELLQLAEEVGDQICLLKTHADIIQDFGTKTMHDLEEVARRKGFLIFEDRKFGDIGSTVQLQYTSGPLQIARWSNIVNAHIFPGPAIITALAEAAVNAIAAYNTSVETQISGPSPNTTAGSYSDSASSSIRPVTEEVEEQDVDRLSSDDDDEVQSDGEPVQYSDEDQLPELQTTTTPDRNLRRISTNEIERKLSVVSVSTTISTKTEHISPLATPSHHSHHKHSASDYDFDSTEDLRTVAALGSPPIARGLLLFAQMSSAGNLMDEAYAAKSVEAARGRPDFVIGFIAQRSLNELPDDNFITMTPGVNIASKGDKLGQQYNTPEKVVGEAGSDIVIVGRGIYGATDRRAAAEEYRVRAWKAYEERVAAKTGSS